MKVLRSPNNFATRVLGQQKVEDGIKYRDSDFVITDGESRYNTLTGESLYQADEKTLIERWFKVPENMDETMLAHLLRQKSLQIEQGPGGNIKHRFIIFLTTDCNGNCEYCFEKGMTKMYMSKQTAEDVADYIASNCNKNESNIVRLFGGEPLMNIGGINTLTDRLKQNGVNFQSEIFTNGDRLGLVDTDTLKNRWNIKKVQLTADDIGDEYDRIKGLPVGAWDRLVENMKRITSAGIRINLRIHYHPGKDGVAAKRVIDAMDEIPDVHLYMIMLYEAASMEDYKGLLAVEDYIASKGKYGYNFPGVFYGKSCMADDRRNACITPDGHLSPCEHYPYGQNYGSIYKRGYDQEILKRWSEKHKHYCGKCVHYPSCGSQHLCPAQSLCNEALVFYKTETIKKVMRAKINDLHGNADTNGADAS